VKENDEGEMLGQQVGDMRVKWIKYPCKEVFIIA